ncbi:fatty acid-binding protein 9-like [Choloepus didactylus]|uniref:fatty acid-binding protein 9-like n=1 Tax=Choloepus didactylus TaxID=27675 RepID=UPI0018A0B643|nr:fatty acid-binding protein 9-like [Choloepus didactylus]
MAEPFLGTWKMLSCENWTKMFCFLCLTGVSLNVQKMVASMKPILHIGANGDKLYFKTESSFKPATICFKLGQEFDETTEGNKKVKSIVTLDNGSMIQVQKWLDKETTIKREVVDEKMVEKYTKNNVVSTRIYEKM